jgi:hypothetical protein
VTVTGKVLLAVLPRVSDALQVTTVVPTANPDPDAGAQTTGRVPSTLSLADAVNAIGVAAAVASLVMPSGTVMTGAV